MIRRVLFPALFVLLTLAVGFAVSEEYTEKVSDGDSKEIIMMIKGGGEGHEMMIEGLGECCGMMKGMSGMGQMGCGHMLGMKKELGLTDDQTAKLKSMKTEQEKRSINDRAAIEILEVELRDLLSEETVDIKAVDAKIDKIGVLKAKMHKDRVHLMVDSKKVLTPEQREKMGGLMGPGMGMMKKQIECKKMMTKE